MANKYSVLLKFLVNLNSHSVFKFEGKIKFSTCIAWQSLFALSMCILLSLWLTITGCDCHKFILSLLWLVETSLYKAIICWNTLAYWGALQLMYIAFFPMKVAHSGMYCHRAFKGIRKELSIINLIYYWHSFFKTHERYNYLHLITNNTSRKLFTKDIKSCLLN